MDDKTETTNCRWEEDSDEGYWSTECGHAFSIIAGTPSDNGMRFCCYCGGRLAIKVSATEEDIKTLEEA